MCTRRQIQELANCGVIYVFDGIQKASVASVVAKKTELILCHMIAHHKIHLSLTVTLN